MSPSQAVVDLNRLQESISSGIISGTAGVVAGFAAEASKRHDMRGVVDQTQQKVYELDREVVLLKGMMTALIGKGDGETGMVPRVERDMSGLKTVVTTLQGQIRELDDKVEGMAANIQTIMDKQGTQTSFMAGWKGVYIAVGLAATCCTVIGGIVAGVIWLYHH